MGNDNTPHIGAPDSTIAALGDTLRVFEDIPTGIIAMDATRRVLMANRVVRELLGLPEAGCPAIPCHELLGQDGPCRGCPLTGPKPLSSSHNSLSIKNSAGDIGFFREHLSPWGDNYIITLCDVSREIKILRKTELARKELQAKNVLLERNRRETAEDKNRLSRLLDHLPDALVMTGGDYRIHLKNRAAGQMLPNGGARQCFELFDKEFPCEACPARDGFDAAEGKKTNHFVAGQYYTEDIIKSPDGEGGLLLFRNTTRQIQLIEKIRDQQETITRKNDILSSLVKFETMMQKEKSPRVVADFFLDIFMAVCHASAASVVIQDIRPASLWFTAQKGLTNTQMTQLTRACLSTRGGAFFSATLMGSDFGASDFRQIDIVGGDGRRVGFAFLVDGLDKENESLIPLFFEPLGAYIHNRLLMRQLEERANTDPLTGLYNRSYLEIMLQEEKRKQEQYDIPYAVVMADVNRLKQANDQYGHDTGDRLILTVAELLTSAIRETDSVARTGGDEFVLLLANTTQESAERVVERLSRSVFKDVALDLDDGELFPVTVSFGAAGVDMTAAEDLLKEADRRMYEAKSLYYQNHARYR